MNRIKCTFKGHCGNKMEGEYCSNVPSISCSWQEPQPDQDKIECKFEDWDDTVLPRPACHCMKRKDVDCANVPDDVESCPDYEPKPQPDQDEIERDKISKSNAIGMGLIPPDQSSEDKEFALPLPVSTKSTYINVEDQSSIEALGKRINDYLDGLLGYDYSGIRPDEILRITSANPTSKVEG